MTTVEHKLENVLGGAVPVASLVLHVAALSAAGEVLRIQHDAPRSEFDFFLLNAARARSDAILTTGRILREEPEVRHEIQGAPKDVEALTGWREVALRKSEPPFLIVLSSGRDLDPHHPAFAASPRPVVFTAEARVTELRRSLPGEVVVVGDTAPSLRRALAFTRSELGAQAVSIEAGPSTALSLYDDPLQIDELWLSEYLEANVSASVRGPRFLAPNVLDSLLATRSRAEHTQTSGRWRFTRRSRTP
ncbi:MAG: hypothetical protein GY937_05825 [bacterium]|nr:hypothetical protein [bacterium]